MKNTLKNNKPKSTSNISCRVDCEVMRHWFCFTYIGKSLPDHLSCEASTYTGYDNKLITKKKIDENKKNANVTSDAVLLNCIYLGEMTKEQFLGA